MTCTCTKSNYNKKYFECDKLGEKCNINCRCVNCLNNEEEKNNKKNYFLNILIQNKKIYIDIKPIYEESNISFHNSSINTTFMVINEKKW